MGTNYKSIKMKKIIIILGLLVMSCSTNPDYQNNLKLAKKWVEAFETSNLELWKEVVSQELVDVAPMYGMGQVDYKTSLQVAEFYVQNTTEVGDFPRIDFFINAKIRQTRLFLKAEHLNSSFTGYNFYSAPNYPYRDFIVRFGIVWNFFL